MEYLQKDLAEMFGLESSYVGEILRGKVWLHLTEGIVENPRAVLWESIRKELIHGKHMRAYMEHRKVKYKKKGGGEYGK